MTNHISRRMLHAGALLLALLLIDPAHADSQSIAPAAAASHVGETATVCGPVASTKYATNTHRQPTFLNLDRPYPNHIFTAVIWGSDRARFSYPPESLQGSRICVTGAITLYKGRPEIIVTSPGQIRVQK